MSEVWKPDPEYYEPVEDVPEGVECPECCGLGRFFIGRDSFGVYETEECRTCEGEGLVWP